MEIVLKFTDFTEMEDFAERLLKKRTAGATAAPQEAAAEPAAAIPAASAPENPVETQPAQQQDAPEEIIPDEKYRVKVRRALSDLNKQVGYNRAKELITEVTGESVSITKVSLEKLPAIMEAAGKELKEADNAG